MKESGIHRVTHQCFTARELDALAEYLMDQEDYSDPYSNDETPTVRMKVPAHLHVSCARQ